MGIRSDVGVAVKKGPLLDEFLAAETNLPVLDWAVPDAIEHEEGALFIFKDVKWYTDTDSRIKKLYDILAKHPQDCLVVEACSEYPDHDDGDFGEWDDNPWSLCRNVSVSLSY